MSSEKKTKGVWLKFQFHSTLAGCRSNFVTGVQKKENKPEKGKDNQRPQAKSSL